MKPLLNACTFFLFTLGSKSACKKTIAGLEKMLTAVEASEVKYTEDDESEEHESSDDINFIKR